MSTSSETELDALIGDWADAVSEDADDIDSLADAWARKDGRDPAAIAEIPPPPPIDEPITLPKRPDPVLMPPLPSRDFAGEAKHGDTRYASPMPPPVPPPAPDPAPTPTETPKPAPSPVAPASASPQPTPRPAEPLKPAAPRVQPSPRPALGPAGASDGKRIKPENTIHEYMVPREERGWKSWLPFGLVVLGVLLWLGLMIVSGQNNTDTNNPPRVIDQPELANAGAADDTEAATPAPTSTNFESLPVIRPREEMRRNARSEPLEPPSPTEPRAAEETGNQTLPTEIDSAPIEPKPTPPDTTETTSDPIPAPRNPVDTAPAPAKPASDTAELTPIKADISDTLYAPKPTPTDPKSDPKPDTTLAVADPADVVTPTPIATNPDTTKSAETVAAPGNAPPGLKPDFINANIRPALQNEATASLPPRADQPPASRETVHGAGYSPSRDNVVPVNAPPKTVGGLLFAGASKNSATPTSVAETSPFYESVKRALDYGEDGQALALETPDGRLLAMRVDQTHMDQIRSVLIPRAPEVSLMPTNLTLKDGVYQSIGRTGLRAGPIEGPAIRSLEGGERVESIGIVGGTDWQLVAQKGRGIGFLRSGELKRARGAPTYPVFIDNPRHTDFDIARVKTVCRTLQFAIDKGGESGSFTACRAFGGEWVVETAGDTPALSPRRYVFKR